jgi:hypothetical protein
MPNWNDVLKQVGQLQARGKSALDGVRREYLIKLQARTGRNVIAYYSGWLSKPGIAQLDINDEDKNGFMMAVHKLDRTLGLDLILHTPGGSIAATQSIVDYLHKMFKSDIRAIVPQIAMSAGTMIACSCKSILMSEHSNLGPIDPHLRGVPAYGALAEFKKAFTEIKKDGSKIHVWGPIIGQYRPTFLGQCQHAIDWSNKFVEDCLAKVMLAGEAHPKKKAQAIRKKLADYSGNKAHDRHIHMDECKAIGLKVERLEDDGELQDLILTVHHCYMHALMNTPAFKIIENHLGTAYVKQQVQMVQNHGA